MAHTSNECLNQQLHMYQNYVQGSFLGYREGGGGGGFGMVKYHEIRKANLG